MVIDGIQLLLKGATRAAVESALNAKELSVNEEVGKLELIYQLSDSSGWLHFADNSLQCLLAEAQALTGEKTFDAKTIFKNELNLHSDAEASLGAGAASMVAAQAAQDSVAGISRVYLAPTTGNEYYSFSDLEDGQPLFIYNSSSSDGAVIDGGPPGNFTVPTLEMTITLYRGTGTILMPCGV